MEGNDNSQKLKLKPKNRYFARLLRQLTSVNMLQEFVDNLELAGTSEGRMSSKNQFDIEELSKEGDIYLKYGAKRDVDSFMKRA